MPISAKMLRQATLLVCWINLLIMVTACSEPSGRFYWAVTKDAGKDLVEKMTFSPDVYTQGGQRLDFKTSETIWWVFKFDTNPGDPEFTVLLARKTFGWVTDSYKKLEWEPEDELLRDSLRLDEPGCYRIQIAQEDKIIGTAAFRIRSAVKTAYQVDLDLDDPEPDEILKFSRNVADARPCP